LAKQKGSVLASLVDLPEGECRLSLVTLGNSPPKGLAFQLLAWRQKVGDATLWLLRNTLYKSQVALLNLASSKKSLQAF
jgi:hypothetical protein